MSYLVLARKYRPQRFSDMIGQAHVTKTLRNAIGAKRAHHAYLFCGVRGLGKTTAARILARGLVCEEGPTPDPCNVCEQCKAVLELRSVDVREIDGASNNSVDDIRALREQVHYLPQSARKKIYIIDEVHMLSASAFNALLKTLEEPPEHVNFIFATTDPHKVLPTILSRVFRLDFRRVAVLELAQHLQSVLKQEGLFADEDALRIVAECADGSVRDAMTLLDKVIAFSSDPQAINAEETRAVLGLSDPYAISRIVSDLLARDVPALLQHFDQAAGATSDLQHLAMGVLKHLRDLTVVQVTAAPDAFVQCSAQRLQELKEQAASSDPLTLAQYFDRFSQSVDRLAKSANPRLSLEMALIELALAPPMMDVDAVVDRLAAIAGGGEDPGPGPGPGSGPGSGSRSARSPESGATRPKSPPQTRTSAAQNPTPKAAFNPPTQSVAPPQTRPKPAETPTPEAAFNPLKKSAAPPQARPEEPTPIPESDMSKKLWAMVRGEAPAQGRPPKTPPVQPPSAPAHPPEDRPPAPRDVVSASPDKEPRRKPDVAKHPTEHPVGQPAEHPAEHSTEHSLEPPAEDPVEHPFEHSLEPDSEQPPFVPSPDYEGWERALLDLRDRNDGYLLALVADFGVRRFSPEEVVLVAPKKSFSSLTLGQKSEGRERFEAWLQSLGIEAKALQWVEGMADLCTAPSWNLVESRRLAQHLAAVEAQARSAPETQKLHSHLRAEFISVQARFDHRGQAR